MDTRKFSKPTIKDLKSQGFVNNQVPTRDEQAPQRTDVTETGAAPGMTEAGTSGMSPEKDEIQTYLDYLKDNEVTEDEIFAVLDSIVTTGEVYWSFQLFDRIEIVFRMRPAWVNDALVEALGKTQPQLYAHFTGLVSRYNLAGSLFSYNKKKVCAESPEKLEESMTFVQSLPFAIQSQLVKRLAVFDRVIAVATSEWAVENFTKPQSDE